MKGRGLRWDEERLTAYRKRGDTHTTARDRSEPAPAGKDLKPGVASGKNTRKHTDYNAMLYQQYMLTGALRPITEYRFDPERKWRLDFCWPEHRLAVEIDGAVHRIKGRWKASFEREQALFFAGWRLLKVSTEQVRSGEALTLIEKALQLLRERS